MPYNLSNRKVEDYPYDVMVECITRGSDEIFFFYNKKCYFLGDSPNHVKMYPFFIQVYSKGKFLWLYCLTDHKTIKDAPYENFFDDLMIEGKLLKDLWDEDIILESY